MRQPPLRFRPGPPVTRERKTDAGALHTHSVHEFKSSRVVFQKNPGGSAQRYLVATTAFVLRPRSPGFAKTGTYCPRCTHEFKKLAVKGAARIKRALPLRLIRLEFVSVLSGNNCETLAARSFVRSFASGCSFVRSFVSCFLRFRVREHRPPRNTRRTSATATVENVF